MPKLPVVKASELLRVLLKAGFCKHHQVGSHIQLKHADGRRTTIPYHPSKEITRKTLKAIIEDLNISVEDFTKLLRK